MQRDDDADPYTPPGVTHLVAAPPLPPPRPWLAALLSVLTPGAGQYYADRRGRMVVWLLISVWVLGAMLLLRIWWLGFLVLGILRVLVPIDAYRQARRSAKRASWPRVVLAVTLCFLFWLSLAEIQRSLGIESFYIPNSSMSPALVPGDSIYVDKLEYEIRDPERGDIVVFRLPDDPSERHVKRIIGLPGETVEIRGREVRIDGRPLPQSDAGHWAIEDAESLSRNFDRIRESSSQTRSYSILFEPYLKEPVSTSWKVPSDAYLMLGDHRDRSKDSRRWTLPFVPRENLLGPTTTRYFSRDPQDGAVRFDRIGSIDE
jgi:signal peptidase I